MPAKSFDALFYAVTKRRSTWCPALPPGSLSRHVVGLVCRAVLRCAPGAGCRGWACAPNGACSVYISRPVLASELGVRRMLRSTFVCALTIPNGVADFSTLARRIFDVEALNPAGCRT